MTKEYKYVVCPRCKKKLFRVSPASKYFDIWVWCKSCKIEIKFSNIEPLSQCK